MGKGLINSLLGKNAGEVYAYRQDSNRNVICLVHGFSGSARETFLGLPDLICKDEQLDGWDVISIGYATDAMPTIRLGFWAEQPDLDKIAGYLRTNITTLLEGYSRIAFVGHSMGGLVIQRAVLDLADDDRDRISHILFYGTPSAGLNKASWLKRFNSQICDMASNGTFIQKLRRDWNKRYPGNMPIPFVTVAGELDQFVPVESSLQPFPARYWNYTTGNHVEMVKANSPQHPSFQILRTTLTRETPWLKTFKTKELNNLIGDYAGIVAMLKSKVDRMDKRSFKDYIFALEGYSGIDEAIKALKKNPDLVNDTDLMGFLGGRYKRMYLMERMKADFEKSVELYSRGYGLSWQKGDAEQQFFHAINLAFLALQNEDKVKMADWARLAMTATEKVERDDLWKSATRGEASLYLNDLPSAMTGYAEAIRMAGADRRAISSMYLNVFYSCIALRREDWGTQLERLFNEAVGAP